MPCAASPSAIAFTSSGCSLQNSATWSNDRAGFRTSQTAGAFGIRGAACAMAILLCAPPAPGVPAKPQAIRDDWKVAGIYASEPRLSNGVYTGSLDGRGVAAIARLFRGLES